MIFTRAAVTSVNAPRQSAAVTATAQPQSLQERWVYGRSHGVFVWVDLRLLVVAQQLHKPGLQ